MKSLDLDRRVASLSEKLKLVPSDGIRIDFDSFSEPEKQLLRKVWEIGEQYGSSPPSDVMEANKEFVFKAVEVVYSRVSELFMFVFGHALLGDEIEEWFFKLHFYNFLADFADCLKNVRRWSEKDREDFLNCMRPDDGLNNVFRFPRGASIRNTVEGENEGEVKGDN